MGDSPNNLIYQRIYIYLLRLSYLSIFLIITLGLILGLIYQSYEILSLIKFVFPLYLLILGLYSLLFQISLKPLFKKWTFPSKPEMRATTFKNIVQTFGKDPFYLLENGLNSKRNGIVMIALSIFFYLIMKFFVKL